MSKTKYAARSPGIKRKSTMRKRPQKKRNPKAIAKTISGSVKSTIGNEKFRKALKYLPYIITGYAADRLSWLYRHARGEPVKKMMTLVTHPGLAFKCPLPSLNMTDISIGLMAGAGLYAAVWYKRKHHKNYRNGQEYGSARWGNEKDIEPFMDPEFRNNIPLTATERLMCSFPGGTCGEFQKPIRPKYGRNKNVMIVGGSGSGKTRFYAKPSIMQMHSSYVITDPKGTLVLECGKMLQKGAPKFDTKGRPVKDKNGRQERVPYTIKVFNTIDFNKSNHYNPLAYVKSEKDILKLVTVLMENTKGDGKEGDPFWNKAERLLLTAYIGYMYYFVPEKERTFANLIEMLDHSQVKEEDEEAVNAVDLLFQEAGKKDPGNFAVRQYKKYKLAAGKTTKSILISCAARLAPFDIKELRELTAYDEMELDLIGDRLTALFIIISDTDDTFNFLAAMMYSQLFNLLCERADNLYNGHLPIHVRCILDEFANTGKIPNFERLIATIRSREISASVILQSMSQLKAIYKDNADTICGNCDTLLFLGGKEKTTLKDMSETLGKETIDLFNTSDTRGSSQSMGVNYQKTGKELMSQDEISVMDGGKCILQVRGVRPFYSDKYDITTHPMYKELSDYDERNTFDVESYVSHRLKLTKNTVISDYRNLGDF